MDRRIRFPGLRRFSGLVLAAALAPAGVCAQTLPLGGEFPVNTYTTNAQTSPAIAAGGNGTFVVVWPSFVQDAGTIGVFGQRFDGNGEPLGAEFQVNTYTTYSQVEARVAAAQDGSFVVVWRSSYQDGSGFGLFAQRYNASGAKVGGEFRVNTATAGDQQAAAIAMRPSGEFVVVWSGGYSADSDETAQVFNAAGVKVGAPFTVNTFTTGNQRAPAVAIDHAGNFVVVWGSDGQDGDQFGVFGQRFSPTGQKVGPTFQVNTYTTGEQDYPAIAMDRAGNFVVVWGSGGQDGSSTGVFGQRFNSAAEKLGPEFQVNTFTASQQGDASIALEPDGGFIVTWRSFSQDGSDFGVFGQRFDRSGSRRGPEFQVNEYTTGFQGQARVAETEAGPAIVWSSSGPDGDSSGVRLRRQTFRPESLTVDVHGIGITDLNGVLEPGEAAGIEPAWAYRGNFVFLFLGGSVSGLGLTGPPGPTYTLLDATAQYPGTAPGNSVSCYDGNPSSCFAIQISGARPATHWDATLQEDLSTGGSQVWTLHLGDSFTDVPRSQTFYKKIETLLHAGITSGCTTTTYCPDLPVSRGQMAIFVAKGIAGSGENVPTTGLLNGQPYNCVQGGVSRFSDVVPTDSFCRHVHYIGAQNVTLGCSASQYCPGDAITRDAMASFIAKAIVAPGGGNAVPLFYGPDPVTGLSYSCVTGSPNLHFTDVPVTNPFCKHIHYLWAKGIVSGCTATAYCPSDPVNRDAMAKFIANGFGLQLYGP